MSFSWASSKHAIQKTNGGEKTNPNPLNHPSPTHHTGKKNYSHFKWGKWKTSVAFDNAKGRGGGEPLPKAASHGAQPGSHDTYSRLQLIGNSSSHASGNNRTRIQSVKKKAKQKEKKITHAKRKLDEKE